MVVGTLYVLTSSIECNRGLTLLYLQWNREPLWPSGYANSSIYQLVTSLNKVRFTLASSYEQQISSVWDSSGIS